MKDKISGFQQLKTSDGDKDSSNLEKYFTKLRTEQEEIWNTEFQRDEDHNSIRARTSSSGSDKKAKSKQTKDIKINTPVETDLNEKDSKNKAEDTKNIYQKEEVGVRSRERSMENKNKFVSPLKLNSSDKRLSMEVSNYTEPIEVELQRVESTDSDIIGNNLKLEVKSDPEVTKDAQQEPNSAGKNQNIKVRSRVSSRVNYTELMMQAQKEDPVDEDEDENTGLNLVDNEISPERTNKGDEDDGQQGEKLGSAQRLI